MRANILPLIILTFSILSSYGCSKYDSISTTNYSSFDDLHKIAKSDLEEYVSRVGKKILIVVDNPKYNYEFSIINSKSSQLHSNGPLIQISEGLLINLQDEAQLAAVLSNTIAGEQLIDDKNSMLYMSRAGYDPMAAIELQEIYLSSRSGKWLKDVFYNNPPNIDRLAINKQIVEGLPKGLQRAKERFNKNIGLKQNL